MIEIATLNFLLIMFLLLTIFLDYAVKNIDFFSNNCSNGIDLNLVNECIINDPNAYYDKLPESPEDKHRLCLGNIMRSTNSFETNSKAWCSK
jgi:hypothetical protein